MKKFAAHIVLQQYGYLEVEAENAEDAYEIAYANVGDAEETGDEDYEIEIEEIE